MVNAQYFTQYIILSPLCNHNPHQEDVFGKRYFVEISIVCYV